MRSRDLNQWLWQSVRLWTDHAGLVWRAMRRCLSTFDSASPGLETALAARLLAIQAKHRGEPLSGGFRAASVLFSQRHQLVQGQLVGLQSGVELQNFTSHDLALHRSSVGAAVLFMRSRSGHGT